LDLFICRLFQIERKIMAKINSATVVWMVLAFGAIALWLHAMYRLIALEEESNEAMQRALDAARVASADKLAEVVRERDYQSGLAEKFSQSNGDLLAKMGRLAIDNEGLREVVHILSPYQLGKEMVGIGAKPWGKN
jgi:sensor histidine kinase regulating citrate/malate metabolism